MDKEADQMGKQKKRSFLVLFFAVTLAVCILFGMQKQKDKKSDRTKNQKTTSSAQTAVQTTAAATREKQKKIEKQIIKWNPKWEYADSSRIHTGNAVLYHTQAKEKRNQTVCINAGHGTKGGSLEYTPCHPDGSPKVTGGSTKEGAVKATAINEGTTLLDGTSEADMNLKVAKLVKNQLLEDGFDVLMIRESEDVQLDNIARTVMANNHADCHISIHYDSTESDKGAFFISVPEDETYRSMEPVASHWKEHMALGQALITQMEEKGVSIYSSGSMAIDLTQTSYSTIPTVDLEVGDRASSISDEAVEAIAEGITAGVISYFK